MEIVDPLSRNIVMSGVEVFVFSSMAHGLKFCTWSYVFDFVLQMDESNKFGLSNTKSMFSQIGLLAVIGVLSVEESKRASVGEWRSITTRICRSQWFENEKGVDNLIH